MRDSEASTCDTATTTVPDIEFLQTRAEARDHFEMMDKGGRIWETDDDIDEHIEIGHYVILCAPTSDAFKRPFWLAQVTASFHVTYHSEVSWFCIDLIFCCINLVGFEH